MNWKAEVNVFSDMSEDVWTGNGLVFDSKKGAEDWVRDLSMRWTQVRHTRVVPTDEEANR